MAAISSAPKWTKTSLFFVFHLHIFGALIMLQAVTDSLFFSTIGVQSLPLVRLLLAAAMLPLTVVYERTSARDLNNRTFEPMLMLSVFLVLALTLLREFDGRVGTFALMVASPLLQAFLLAEFWNFATRYFTIQESKRAFPALFAAASLGGVVAGLMTSALATLVSTENLLLLWVLVQLGLFGYLRAIRRGSRPVPESSAEVGRAGMGGQGQRNWRERLRARLWGQPLVTGIIGLSFLGAVVLFLAEYVYFDIFSRVYTETDHLTEFLGFWSALSSGINLLLSLLIMPRLTAALGVRNLTLVQPLFALVVFVGLLIAPVLAMGALAFLVIQSRNVVEETNEKFLYKGLSAEVAQVVRGRAEGAFKPLAAAFAAALLYVFGDSASVMLGWLGWAGSAAWVSAAGLVLALAYLGIAWWTRLAYPRAIVERIRTRTFDASLDFGDMLHDAGTSRMVLRQQIASDDAELVCFAAAHLFQVQPAEAIELVGERLHGAEPALAAELLALLAEWSGQAGSAVTQVASSFLGDAAPEVRAAAMRVCRGAAEWSVDAMLSAMGDAAPEVRREAVAGLCGHWDLRMVARGASVLEAWMASRDPEERLSAVAVLADLESRCHLLMLVDLLDDPQLEVRSAVARALSQRADPSCAALVAPISERIAGREPAIRIALTEALLRIGEPSAGAALLEACAGLPSTLRQRAAQFLAAHTERHATHLLDLLADVTQAHDTRLMAAQSLSLVGRRYRGALMEAAKRELKVAYQTILDGHLLREAGHASPGPVDLLHLGLSDRRREALEIVIEIVGFSAQHPDFDTIRTYCFSSDPTARAYAIEALENLADRPIFEWLLPFLTLDPDDEVALALGDMGTKLGLDRQDDDAVGRCLRDAQPWLRACAIYCGTHLGHAGVQAAALASTQARDEVLRETALWSLEYAGFDAGGPEERAT